MRLTIILAVSICLTLFAAIYFSSRGMNRFVGRTYQEVRQTYPYGLEMISGGAIIFSPVEPNVTFYVGTSDKIVFAVVDDRFTQLPDGSTPLAETVRRLLSERIGSSRESSSD